MHLRGGLPWSCAEIGTEDIRQLSLAGGSFKHFSRALGVAVNMTEIGECSASFQLLDQLKEGHAQESLTKVPINTDGVGVHENA